MITYSCSHLNLVFIHQDFDYHSVLLGFKAIVRILFALGQQSLPFSLREVEVSWGLVRPLLMKNSLQNHLLLRLIYIEIGLLRKAASRGFY